MELDYKSLPDEELQGIISAISSRANTLMDEITQLEKQPYSPVKREKKDAIISEYATLKRQLQGIYHYTDLGKNSTFERNFYNSFFCPAIRDCYLACHAKTNEKNLQKIFASLWEIWSEAVYYTPANNER